MHPLSQKRGEAEKQYGFGSHISKAKGVYYQGGPKYSDGKRGAKFSEWARFLRATMFFCKCVISVATMLLIIHITMYILISLI